MNKQDQIIHAALKLYSKHGINKVSMNQIAAEVGITKPAVYYYFPSKEALLKAVVEISYFRYLGKLIDLLNRNDVDLPTKLQGVFRIAADDFVEWNEKLAGDKIERITFDLITMEAMAQFPKLEKEASQLYREFTESAISALKNGIEKGEISNDLDCEETAITLISMVEGTYVVCVSMDDLNIKDTFRRQAEVYMRLLTPVGIPINTLPASSSGLS
ncbi:hypothetical protein CEE37_14125 [candidate division LCP-89 bacterium B3_LCP]|uniref:HTH tetR-type domain-containing protein n=1 Tax=candidate division LCP-89 bacterium B3_LCP TaxID=2012998 RepID=A0A532UQN1_UNCL8|nr:MAG: hypothetical protein CEE37_14125 [candidate division LCP-89 bacterium B3_LCP]